MSWTKIGLAALGLIFLELFLTNRGAESNVGGAETGLTGLLQKFLDPSTPAFSSSSSSSGSSSSSTSSGPQGTGSDVTGAAGPVGPGASTTEYSPSTTPSNDYLVEVV